MFVLESFKGKRSDLPRPSRQRRGKAGQRGLSAEQIPIVVVRDRHGATFDAVLPKLNRASMAAALGDVLAGAETFFATAANPSSPRRAGRACPFTSCPRPALPVPTRRNSTSTTSMAITAGSSNGCVGSTASPPRTCPTIWDGNEPSKPSHKRPIPSAGSSERSGSGHINRNRYKREYFSLRHSSVASISASERPPSTPNGTRERCDSA
jgi:hypothetical protein